MHCAPGNRLTPAADIELRLNVVFQYKPSVRRNLANGGSWPISAVQPISNDIH